MCFEFGSCFGGGRTDDYGGERSNHSEVGGRRRGRRGNNSSNGYYTGPDQKAAYHNRPHTAVDEAGHKAYHDGAGGRGGYAAYPQHKADLEPPKLPTWQNKVGQDAYTGRLHVQEPAAMDYPALGRY